MIAGLLTDTNGFSINSVDSNTYKMAAELNDLNINIYNIYNKVLCVKSMSQYDLMKIAMERLEFLFDGKVAYTYILKDDFERVGAEDGDHEGIVNIGRNIEGVEVSLFIRENDGWSISLRSTGSVDVNKIAAAVGGGGHFMAASGKTTCSLEETKAVLINEIEKALNL